MMLRLVGLGIRLVILGRNGFKGWRCKLCYVLFVDINHLYLFFVPSMPMYKCLNQLQCDQPMNKIRINNVNSSFWVFGCMLYRQMSGLVEMVYVSKLLLIQDLNLTLKFNDKILHIRCCYFAMFFCH